MCHVSDVKGRRIRKSRRGESPVAAQQSKVSSTSSLSVWLLALLSFFLSCLLACLPLLASSRDIPVADSKRVGNESDDNKRFEAGRKVGLT